MDSLRVYTVFFLPFQIGACVCFSSYYFRSIYLEAMLQRCSIVTHTTRVVVRRSVTLRVFLPTMCTCTPSPRASQLLSLFLFPLPSLNDVTQYLHPGLIL
uniref:Putative secreted protein n=1 Tax=Panstrongylus lignarius TaxID=156445 RepID=A0A224XQW7_9HEMI